MTLPCLDQQFSCSGVPALLADAKGSLSDIVTAGSDIPQAGGVLNILLRCHPMASPAMPTRSCFGVFFDLVGWLLRTTASELGPMLLAHLRPPTRRKKARPTSSLSLPAAT